MTRPIKFRAWDRSTGKMLPLRFPISEVPHKELIFLQFTGLLDKNGKEIYEGDIVEGRRYYRPALYGRRTVKIDAHGLTDLERWHEDIEIIGNIYENPELLK